MPIFNFSKFANFCLKEKIGKFENLRFVINQDFLKIEKFEKFENVENWKCGFSNFQQLKEKNEKFEKLKILDFWYTRTF